MVTHGSSTRSSSCLDPASPVTLDRAGASSRRCAFARRWRSHTGDRCAMATANPDVAGTCQALRAPGRKLLTRVVSFVSYSAKDLTQTPAPLCGRRDLFRRLRTLVEVLFRVQL